MTRISIILAIVATIILCSFCSEGPRSFRSVQKYHYEYECKDVLVRRYDLTNHVMLELVRDGKVIDKVKARISQRDKGYSILFDLYFTNYHSVYIVPEYNPDRSVNYFRFRRCWINTSVFKRKKGSLILDYFGFRDNITVYGLYDYLSYLSFMKSHGFFYTLDIGSTGMDTLYNSWGQNPLAVKMRVVDENGSILYSNGI